jgi:hypothetical protein
MSCPVDSNQKRMKGRAPTLNLQLATLDATYFGQVSSAWELGFGSWELFSSQPDASP